MDKKTSGFTLIELLVVMAIIGILSTVLIPNLLSARQRGNLVAAQSYIRNIATQAESSRDPSTGQITIADSSDCTTGYGNKPASITSCTVERINNDNDVQISGALSNTKFSSFEYKSDTASFNFSE